MKTKLLSFKLLLLVALSFFSSTAFGQTNLYSTNFGTSTSLPTGWVGSGSNGWSGNTSTNSNVYVGASGGTNVLFAGTGTNNVTHTLTYSNNLSTVGYNNITVLWGGRGSTAFAKEIVFQWSADGTTWNDVSYTYSKNANAWALVNGGNRINLPAAAAGVSNLRFRWSSISSNNGNYRIDDFSVQGTPATTPTLSVDPAGPLSFTANANAVASAAQDVNITGTNMTPLTGQDYVDTILESFSNSTTEHFEFSIDGGATYTNLEELPITSGAINKTIKVRLKANQAAGTYTDKIIFTHNDQNTPFNITKELVLNATVTQLLAPVISNNTDQTVVYGSTVTYNITASNSPTSYNATNLPTGLAVDSTTGAITGTVTANVGEYTSILSATNATGTGTANLKWIITPKSITVTGITAPNKDYDASTAATINTTGANLSGIAAADIADVQLDANTYTANYNTPAAETTKTVTVTGLKLVGSKAANYTLTQPILSNQTITKKTLSISAASIASKPYDGTLSTGIVTPGLLSGLVGLETLNVTGTGLFTDDANVGVNKPAVITYVLADGTNGGVATNYTLPNGNGTGEIIKADQTIVMPATMTKYIGNGDFSPATSTTSAINPITYVSSNTSVASIVGNQIHILALGTTTITASQAGSANYNSAPDKEMLLTIDINHDVYRSNKTGNWNDIATWYSSADETKNWAPATSTPNENNVVYIQTGHTITLTQNEACKDLHISKGTASNNNTLGKIDVANHTLHLYGKIRSYYSSLNTIPGTSNTNGYSDYPFTATTGKLSVVGGSRDLTVSGEWGATINNVTSSLAPIEINIDENAVVTLNTSVKFSSIHLVKGTLDAKTFTVSADKGSGVNVNGNDITVDFGTTLISSATGSGSKVFQATGSRAGGILKIDGTLKLLGQIPYISMKQSSLNGLVEYAGEGDQEFVKVNGTGANPVNTYYDLKISGTGVKTATGTTLVNNIVTVASGELKLPETADNVAPNVLEAKQGIHNTGGMVTFENNAVLMQDTNANNIGAIIVKRHAHVPANQYNLWSSPVVAQDLYALYGSPDSVPNGKVMEYITKTDTFKPMAAGSKSASAKGYSALGLASNDVTAIFNGVPHNGPVSYNAGANAGQGDGYNLIGNPYPSNFDLDTFYTANESQLDVDVDNTAYFWDNTNNTVYGQWGSSYEGDNYAYYNFSSKSGVAAPRTGATKVPNNIIKQGQGFIVKLKKATASLSFDNTMRTAANTGSVYFKTEAPKRYWLELTTPKQLIISTAVVYNEAAVNTYDKYDTAANTFASDGFYTMTSNAKAVSIQGRQDVNIKDDVVPVGIKAYEAGDYSIRFAKGDNIFADGQDVYLKDNSLNKIVKLTDAGYHFALDKGVNTTRFEIVYQSKTLAVDAVNSQKEIVVYKDADSFVVKARSNAITKVEVYDMLGRLVLVSDKASKEVRIANASLVEGTYVLKISQNNNIVTQKVIK